MLRQIRRNHFNTPKRLFSSGAQSAAGPPPVGGKIVQHNQVSAYKHDNKVNLIIKQSASDLKNIENKEMFEKLVKKCALGLFKVYK